MIKQYQIYSQHLGSSVIISYCEGMLKSLEVESPNIDLIVKAGKNYTVFYCEADFLELAKKHNIKIVELARVITFELFWNKYAYKNSGKIEAERAFKKLTKTEQIGAYDYIPQYESQLKQNPVSKLHASTYLNAKRWIK